MLALWAWTPNLRDCEKQTAIIYKLPSLGIFFLSFCIVILVLNFAAQTGWIYYKKKSSNKQKGSVNKKVISSVH